MTYSCCSWGGTHVRSNHRDTHRGLRTRAPPERGAVDVGRRWPESDRADRTQPRRCRPPAHGIRESAIVGVEPVRGAEIEGREAVSALLGLLAGAVPGRLQRVYRVSQLLSACVSVGVVDFHLVA